MRKIRNHVRSISINNILANTRNETTFVVGILLCVHCLVNVSDDYADCLEKLSTTYIFTVYLVSVSAFFLFEIIRLVVLFVHRCFICADFIGFCSWVHSIP